MMKFGGRILLLSLALLAFASMSAAEARAMGCGPCGGGVKKHCGDWKAATLAKYDVDGDGALSALEQAKMRLDWKMKMKRGERAGTCGVKRPCGSCCPGYGNRGGGKACGPRVDPCGVKACGGVCDPAGSCMRSVRA